MSTPTRHIVGHTALAIPLLAGALGGCVAADAPRWGSPPAGSTSSTSPTSTPTTPAETHSLLTPDELLTRISLDLRGIRPSVDDLRAYDGQPEVLDETIERYLHDPRLHRRMTDLYSELIPSRLGAFHVDLSGYADQYLVPVLTARVAEEPLQMFAHVVEQDLPYSEMMLGNWTMNDEMLGGIFPVDYPAGETGWRRVAYTDGRPGAGVLSTNGMWWFKGSTVGNRQRVRAMLTSRVWLCDDYLAREIDFTSIEAITSEEAMEDATVANPTCASCHTTLDPLAANFWGFHYGDGLNVPNVIERYQHRNEDKWEGGASPGFDGEATGGLGGLGEKIAVDPRFASCFVDEAFTILARADAEELGVDLGDIETTFRDSDLNVREVLRAIVEHPTYQGYDPRLARRLLSPQILSTMVEDLTGYTWTRDGVDLMGSGAGYALLAGSSDGEGPGAGMSTVASALVDKRLAQSAARFVVEGDQGRAGAERVLFSPELDFADTTDDPEGAGRVRDELQRLLLRMLGRDLPSDDPEVVALLDLWGAVWATTGDPTEAWSAVLTAIFRHPDMVMY